MRERELYQHLGFLRFGEYLVESLGTSQRTAQEMMRVDAALAALPLMAAAFEAGAISAGHLRVLSRVARPEDESEWVQVACRLSVRDLRRLVAARRDAALGRNSAVSETAGTSATSDPGGGGRADFSGQASFGPPARGTSKEGPPNGLGSEDEDDAETDRVPVDMRIPSWIAAFFRRTAWMVRRIAGSPLPHRACFEMVLAEFVDSTASLGGAGDSSIVSSPETDLEEVHASARRGKDGLVGAGNSAAWNEPRPGASTKVQVSAPSRSAVVIGNPVHERDSSAASDAAKVHASARAKSDGVHASARPGGHVPLTDDEAKSRARALERELKELFTESQRQDLRLAEHLRLVAVDRGYRDAGFASLEEYAADRFGLSHGALFNLLALRRRLEALPALRRVFLEGRLTARQATLIGIVATAAGVEAWVERARRVSVRALEDEVDFVRHLRESRPDIWELLEGGPSPEGVVLAPGQPPRLQETAPPPGSQAEEVLRGRRLAVVADEVHESALRDVKTAGPSGRFAAAAAFLQTLRDSEAATPFPDRMVTLRLWVEPEVAEMWRRALGYLRSTIRRDLKEWEALAIILKEFWLVWDNEETARQRRENPILERFGWRCAVPGCLSIGSGRLHLHHIIHRSQGGTNDPSILIPVCSGHHLRLIHGGIVRVSGWAPDGVVWEMGVDRVRGPYQVFFGDRKLAGAVSSRTTVSGPHGRPGGLPGVERVG